MSADIFAGQATDADRLAELYDMEHDDVVEDVVFYREMTGRHRGAVLDLGCGSGRLFAALLDGGASRVVGVDGAPALLRRAAARIERTPQLAEAFERGRLVITRGDVRRLERAALRQALGARAALVVLAGVVPHLDGPEELMATLGGVARLLTPRGVAILDDIGPGQLPARDLPLSVDWRRVIDGRQVVRRSQLLRRDAPEGLRVVFSTIVDVTQPDGTIARLPASHRLWYPSPDALSALVREAGLVAEHAYGSHDLDPLGGESDRRILLVRRASGQRAG